MESGVRSRRKAVIQALALALVLAVIIGHTVYWHIEGEHAALFKDAQEGEDLLPVIYNLGLMLVTGTLLGLLLMRLSEALGYQAREISHFEEESDE
jgi:high-affinity Fe2+/Pb2+ permease